MIGSALPNLSTNYTINISLMQNCQTIYIDQSMNGTLLFSLGLLACAVMAMTFLFDFKVKNKYAKVARMLKLSGPASG